MNSSVLLSSQAQTGSNGWHVLKDAILSKHVLFGFARPEHTKAVNVKALFGYPFRSFDKAIHSMLKRFLDN